LSSAPPTNGLGLAILKGCGRLSNSTEPLAASRHQHKAESRSQKD
jgi:hypothetical protein